MTGEYTRGQMVVEKRADASDKLQANVDIVRILEKTEVQRIFFDSFDKK